jgi:hypothetical protein
MTELDTSEALMSFVSEVRKTGLSPKTVMPNGKRLRDCSREEVQDVVSSLLALARMLATEKSH